MASDEQIRILISAVDEASRNLKSVEEGLKGLTQKGGEAKQAAEGTSAGFNIMGSAAGILSTAISALGISLSVEGVRRLAEMGAASLAQEGAFKTLAAQAGLSSEAMLNTMRTASEGTVSEMQLVSIGAKTLATGLSLDLGQMSNLMMLAKDRANAFGIETGQAYETITRAIEYQSPRMLRSVGLVLDTKEAYRLYAESIHKSVDALTEQEQQQAFFNAILKQSQGELGNLSGGADKAEDSMKRAKVAAENLALAFGKLLAPAIGEAAQRLSEFLNITKEGIDATQRAIVMNDAQIAGNRAYIDTIRAGGTAAEAAAVQTAAMSKVIQAAGDMFVHGSSTAKDFGKSVIDTGNAADIATKQLDELKKKAQEIAASGLKAEITFATGGTTDFTKQEEAQARYNASALKSNAELRAALADQDTKFGDTKAKLEQEWQDKIAWVREGANKRTKEEEIAAEKWWDDIYNDKMRTLDNSYADEILKVKDKYKTQNQLAADQYAKEKADFKRQSEERLQVYALELMSQKGELDKFFGGVHLSGQDAFNAIKSGVIPLGPEISRVMTGAMDQIKGGQGSMAESAKLNTGLMKTYFDGGSLAVQESFARTGDFVHGKYTTMDKDAQAFVLSARTQTSDLSKSHMTEFGSMGDKVASFKNDSVKNFDDMSTKARDDIYAIRKAIDDLPKNTDITITTHHVDVNDSSGDQKKTIPTPAPVSSYPAIAGHQAGGSFTVPPGYPNDTFIVGLTTGEKVDVNRAGGVSSGNSDVTIVFQSLVPPNDYEMARIAQRIRPYLQRQEGRE